VLAEQKPLWAPTRDAHGKPGGVLCLAPPPSATKIAYHTQNLISKIKSITSPSYLLPPYSFFLCSAPSTNYENLRPNTLEEPALPPCRRDEQLKRVNIRLLKHLTGGVDDPVAISASRGFSHTAHGSTNDLREGRGIGGRVFGPA